MKTLRVLLIVSLSVLALAGCNSRKDNPPPTEQPLADKSTPDPGTPADNTAVNTRDRNNTLTPLDQGASEADRTLTQKVRQAVVAEDSLSTAAHNIKIITVNGMVTLRGPVNSKQEKNTIHTRAVEIAGATQVDDQLEVTQ